MNEPPEIVPPEEEVGPLTPFEAPPVPVTRAARAWVGIVLGVVLLALLLVFIFQNLHHTTIHFFTASGSLPVALVLLIAALAGAGLVLLVGSVRIVQLRRKVRGSSPGRREGRARGGGRRSAKAGASGR